MTIHVKSRLVVLLLIVSSVAAKSLVKETLRTIPKDVYKDDDEEEEHEWEVNRAEECTDLRRECPQWLQQGRDCNDKYVRAHCTATCKTCREIIQIAPPSRAGYYRDDRGNSNLILTAAGSAVGVPQVATSKTPTLNFTRAVRETVEYYQDEVMTLKHYTKVRAACKNKHALCTTWAMEGHCEQEDREDYMLKECPVACQWCYNLHAEARCPWDPMKTKNAWYPGDCNAMFERIVASDEWQTTILSRPTPENKLPWVVVIDDFITTQEADRLVELGYEEGYERSTDVGDETPDGDFEALVSTGRTSQNAWCEEKCMDDQLTRSVFVKLENLVQLSMNHSESLQLLRYEVGQRYDEHHDYVELEYDRYEGVRILTVFMYLNDVEEGGATRFTNLGIEVQPKRGRAVLWPSVLNEDPHERDAMTHHAALAVTKGIKFGANAWFHQRNFMESHQKGC
jgi:prolyl 4-hydroxylase